MIPLLVGLGLLVGLLLAADLFSRAPIGGIKRLLAWVAALAGLSAAVLLMLTGRAGGAVSALLLAAPLVAGWWQESARRPTGAKPPGRPGAMSRAEALAVLGLAEGASAAEIRAAHRRLMQALHPDHGGSAWIAARLNEARSVLVGK